MGRPRHAWTRSVAGCLTIAALLALPALAKTIVGTKGPDTIRGTAKGDRIYGRAGNDRLLGLAGNDVLDGGAGRDYLDGGAGSDQLKIRDNVRDTAVCGPGRDTVTADRLDAVRANCEKVLRPALSPPGPPPPPPSPPPPPPPPPAPPAPPPPAPGGSRANPVPFGLPADVGNGWTVAVTLVFPNATDEVLAANPSNDPPAAGNQFFMVAATASYTGPGSSRLDSGFAMRAVGASQATYTMAQNGCGALPPIDLVAEDPQVPTGSTVSGNAACWEIRTSDADSLVMSFVPRAGGRTTWFALR